MTRRVSRAPTCRPRALLTVAALAGCALATGASVAHAAPTWLSPVTLSPAGQGSANVQVRMDQNSQSLVVFDGPEERVWLARRLSGGALGAFGAPVALSDAGGVASDPQISDIAFSAPVDLSAADEDAVDPHIASSGGGDATAVWRRTGADDAVRAAGLDAAGPLMRRLLRPAAQPRHGRRRHAGAVRPALRG